MESWWMFSLVLCCASSASCAALPRTTSGHHAALIIGKAVDSYNRGPGVTSVFKLLEAEPSHRLDTPTHPGQLQFTIKETACAKQLDSQHKDKCAFKDLGQVKDCTATIFPEDLADTIVVICDTVEAKAPVRRSRQARQCVREKGRLKCKPPPRPGFASALAPVRRSRQAKQCVLENGRLKCKPPPRPGFASAVARPSRDKIV